MNEVTAAAERYDKYDYPRASASGGKDWDSYYEHIQEHKDSKTLALAYLALAAKVRAVVADLNQAGYSGKLHELHDAAFRARDRLRAAIGEAKS